MYPVIPLESAAGAAQILAALFGVVATLASLFFCARA